MRRNEHHTATPPLDAHAQLQVLVDSLDEAVYGRSLDNRILSWNRGAERIFGYRAEEVLGRSMEMLLPPDRPGELDSMMARIRRGERIERYETVRVRKDGQLIDVQLTVSPARDAEGRISGALVIARDVTRSRQTDRRLRELQAQGENRALVLDTANRVALDILASRTGIEALRHIAEAARTLAGAQYAALGVARPDGKGLAEFVTVGLTPEEEAAIGPPPQGRGVLGVLLERTEPLRIDDLTSHPRSVGVPASHPVMKSFLGVPIRRGETALGSLYLTNKIGGGVFTEADEAAVQALGAYAAVAIHNLQLLSRQRALVSGLIAAQEEERRAVAYDLHDGLTQFVMASHAHLEAFKRLHRAGCHERAERELDQGLCYLKEAVIESRRLVNGLRSLALDDLGLAGALEQLVAEEKARAGWVDAELVHNVAGRRFHKSVETALYRVAQEALTNARKHASTDRVRVVLLLGEEPAHGPRTLMLEITDWGRGFDPERVTLDGGSGVGLQGIYERIRLLSGIHRLRSAPGRGTTLQATVPVIEAQGEGDSQK